MKRVLIVEDELIIALTTEKMVQKLGHEVIGKVTRGEEAVQEAMNLKPDVILMDIRLAGEMDGIDATKEIKNQDLDVTIIYITGNSDQSYYERAEMIGFKAYLYKPVTLNQLKDYIK